MSVLSAPYMHDEAAAFAHVEAMLWPEGPVCPHCGMVDRAYRLEGVRTKPSKKNPEGKKRHGLWKCRECRGQFTVRKGTIFEESHLPLHLWLQAIHLMVSSKKGISSHQLHRVLGITYKSAWFLTHRIRECMRQGDFAPFGSGGGIVEVDETFIGKEREKPTKARGAHHKMKMMTLVDRDTGRAKSVVVDDLKRDTFKRVIEENMSREAVMVTDDYRAYRQIAGEDADDAGEVFAGESGGEVLFRSIRSAALSAPEGGVTLIGVDPVEGREGVISLRVKTMPSSDHAEHPGQRGIRVHIRKNDHYCRDMLGPLGIEDCIRDSVSHETARVRRHSFGPMLAADIRKRGWAVAGQRA